MIGDGDRVAVHPQSGLPGFMALGAIADSYPWPPLLKEAGGMHVWSITLSRQPG
jgi:hypothetical protein